MYIYLHVGDRHLTFPIILTPIDQTIPEMRNITRSEIEKETQKDTTESESNGEEGKPVTGVIFIPKVTKEDTQRMKDALTYNDKSDEKIKENITESENKTSTNENNFRTFFWNYGVIAVDIKT